MERRVLITGAGSGIGRATRLRGDGGRTTLEITEGPVRGPLADRRVQGVVRTLLAVRNRAMGRRLQRLVARREEQRRLAGDGA